MWQKSLSPVELPDTDSLESQSEQRAWLTKMLEIVRQRKGLDFSGYRASTLSRRVHNRMIAVNAPTLSDYFVRLRDDPAEAEALVQKITIKVSRFFRDGATFDALRRALETKRDEGKVITCWSAGCGQGEEAYSLAILLQEVGQSAAGTDVWGTDIDPLALARAADACYPAASLQGVCERRMAHYFYETRSPRGPVYCVRPEIRNRVGLQLHDVTRGLGWHSFDLVCCRNVLIYLDLPLQRRVLEQLVSSLAPGGLLCLGEAEWIPSQWAQAFEVVERKSRLFRLLG